MKQRFAGVLVAMLPTLALASSYEAWQEFRIAVEQSCRAAVEAPAGSAVTVEVNPFGSKSYGAALLTVGQDRVICIFDKTTKRTELTAPFADTAAD